MQTGEIVAVKRIRLEGDDGLDHEIMVSFPFILYLVTVYLNDFCSKKSSY